MPTMIIILVTFVITGTYAVINPYGPTIVADYSKCIIQIIEKDFRRPGLIIFANSNNVSTSVTRIRTEILKTIHKTNKYSVQVASPENEIEICNERDENVNVLSHLDLFTPVPVADYFIIIIDNFKEFSYLASKLIRSRNWNPLAKFVVLLFNFNANDDINVEPIERMMTCLFRYNVINIVVLVPEVSKIRNAIIYSWRPYDPPNYCGYPNETAKNRLQIENYCETGVLKRSKRVLDSRIPSDMKGCTLFIIALERQPFVSRNEEDPNVEKWLMREIVTTFNLTPQYEIVDASRGERDSGDWDGALKQLLDKRGSVLLGGIFPDFDVHEDFHCSSPYLADSYTWVVPRAIPSPRWLPLIIIFDKLVWLSCILAFILCVVAWTVIGQLSKDSIENRTLSHCFINTWICMLGFCTYSRPKKTSLRTFFVFLNLYCMMCVTAYVSKLIDVLRNPSFEYQIHNVEELVNSGLQFGGFEELHDLFLNSTDPFDSYLGERWTDIKNISRAMIDVAVHRNFSLLCSRLELAHISAIMPELSDSFGNYKYYAFKRNMFSVPMEMVSLKGFPFMPKFSETVGLFQQMGVSAALRKYFAAFNMRRRAKLLRLLEGERPDIDALSIQHLQGGFLALILGYTFGTVAFLIEIIIDSDIVVNKINNYKIILKNGMKMRN